MDKTPEELDAEKKRLEAEEKRKRLGKTRLERVGWDPPVNNLVPKEYFPKKKKDDKK